MDLRGLILGLRGLSFGPERTDFGPERADLGPERADLGPERGLGGGDGWTYVRTYGRMDVRTYGRMDGNSPPCPTGHRPFGAAAQKREIEQKQARLAKSRLRDLNPHVTISLRTGGQYADSRTLIFRFR